MPRIDNKPHFVLEVRFERVPWLTVHCPWAMLFRHGNGCMACGRLWDEVRLVVQMDAFRERRAAAASRPVRIGALLEWLRTVGVVAELR